MRIILSIPLKLSEISEYTSGVLLSKDATVNALTLSSALVEANDLFIALRGERYDGVDFIPEVRGKGAFVISESEDSDIIVKSAHSALLALAAHYKTLLPRLKYTVAITGSVGKTTTRQFLYELIKGIYKAHSSQNNYNNLIGVSYTILSAPLDTEIMLLEVGMNHSGEISRISSAVHPNIAIITNIGTAHIGNLGSRDAIAKAKLEINDGMNDGITLVPLEEELLSNVQRRYTVSLENEVANALLRPLSIDSTGSTFDFESDCSRLQNASIKIAGRHILSCLSFALAAASILGTNEKHLREALNSITSTLLRQRMFSIGKYRIYDDTYSSSPDALIAVMDMLSLYKAYEVSAVLSDMLELGDKTQEMHFIVGKHAAELGFKKLYLYGTHSDFISSGAISAGFDKKNIYINRDVTSPETTAAQIASSYEGELLLFKGSHAMHTERIFQLLKHNNT